MLTAIDRGKAGRILISEAGGNVSWRDLFRRSEDLLTAVFFSRMRFLSQTGLNRVLSQLLGQEAAAAAGEIEDIEFWPHLQGMVGRAWVEPDVILHFENATVMIEVKPPFGGSQIRQQWEAQIGAYVAECRLGSRRPKPVVHFLALGRNSNKAGVPLPDEFDTEGFFDLSIHLREWEVLQIAMPEWIAESSGADRSVFSDWNVAFELFGLASHAPEDWIPLVVWSTLRPLSLSVMQDFGAVQIEHLCEPTPSVCSWSSLIQFSHRHPLEKRK